MSLKAVVIDDEQDAREVLVQTIEEFCSNVTVLGQANGVVDGVKLLKTGSPDIVFLDIQMLDGTGFDLLDLVSPFNFKVIFVTAYDKYAIKAFQYSALDYILKPLSPLNLVNAINKYKEEKAVFSEFEHQIELLKSNINGKVQKIAVPTSDGVKFLKIDEIIHCKSDGCYTVFYLEGIKELTVTRTLKEYADILPEDVFYRIHKSHLINVNYIEQYVNRDGGMVIMENNNSLPIARNRKDEFLKVINLK